jgi:hypothetical protein
LLHTISPTIELVNVAAHIHKELANPAPVSETVKPIAFFSNAATLKKVSGDFVATPPQHSLELAGAHAPQLITIRLLVLVFETHIHPL